MVQIVPEWRKSQWLSYAVCGPVQVVEDCDERLTTEAVEALITTVDEMLPPAPERAEPTEDEAT